MRLTLYSACVMASLLAFNAEAITISRKNDDLALSQLDEEDDYAEIDSQYLPEDEIIREFSELDATADSASDMKSLDDDTKEGVKAKVMADLWDQHANSKLQGQNIGSRLANAPEPNTSSKKKGGKCGGCGMGMMGGCGMGMMGGCGGGMGMGMSGCAPYMTGGNHAVWCPSCAGATGGSTSTGSSCNSGCNSGCISPCSSPCSSPCNTPCKPPCKGGTMGMMGGCGMGMMGGCGGCGMGGMGMMGRYWGPYGKLDPKMVDQMYENWQSRRKDFFTKKIDDLQRQIDDYDNKASGIKTSACTACDNIRRECNKQMQENQLDQLVKQFKGVQDTCEKLLDDKRTQYSEKSVLAGAISDAKCQQSLLRDEIKRIHRCPACRGMMGGMGSMIDPMFESMTDPMGCPVSTATLRQRARTALNHLQARENEHCAMCRGRLTCGAGQQATPTAAPQTVSVNVTGGQAAAKPAGEEKK